MMLVTTLETRLCNNIIMRKLSTFFCYVNEEIVYFLLSCLLQTVWFLVPNLEDFDLSELLD